MTLSVAGRFAVCLAVAGIAAGCTVGKTAVQAASGDGGGVSTLLGGGARCTFAPMPPGTALDIGSEAVSADATGVVSYLFGPRDGGIEYRVESMAADGTDAVLFRTVMDHIPENPVSDAETVYFVVGRYPSPSVLYAAPHDGSSPATPVLSSTTGDIDNLALDADHIYATVSTVGTSTTSERIVSIDKATMTASTIYAADPGQELSGLFVDGTTLWWQENSFDNVWGSPETIRTASIATTLAPIAFATSPFHLGGFVEANGTVAYVNGETLTNLDGGAAISAGIYMISRDGTITLADSQASGEIAIGAGGVVYYAVFGGIRKLKIGPSAAWTVATVVPNAVPFAMRTDPSGNLYYWTADCIDKVAR